MDHRQSSKSTAAAGHDVIISAGIGCAAGTVACIGLRAGASVIAEARGSIERLTSGTRRPGDPGRLF
jgi:hypothetical protein